MNNVYKFLAAAVLAAMAGQAMAASDSVDVKLTGKIVPPACTPAVSGGAVFDYGTIKAASLAQDDYTALGEKGLNFTVTCDSPMKVAFRTLDGRAGTGITLAGNSNPLMGLGTFEGKNIGGYTLFMLTGGGFYFEVDGAKGNFAGLKSYDNGQTWQQSGAWNIFYFDQRDNFLSSISIRDSQLPLAFTTFSGSIKVKTTLNKGSELNLTKVIPLDGQATIQMVYL